MVTRRLYNSNESIISGILASDDSALEYLYSECYPLVHQLILNNSGSADEVKDILQDGIMVVWEKVKDKNLVLTCNIKTYIYSVCRNLWLKALRGKSIQVTIDDSIQGWVPVNEEDDDKEVLEERHILIAELMNKIGETCKMLLTLFYYEELSMNSIAERMSYTNADNAKAQKYKCIKKLQKLAHAAGSKESN